MSIEHLEIQAGSVGNVAPYLQQKRYGKLLMICDSTTYQVAGKFLEHSIKSVGLQVLIVEVQPQTHSDVIADETAIVQILLQVDVLQLDCFLAVGAGTIHDLTRFVASRTNLPFISIPTAPSVDGFTSVGAPIIVKGEKKTILAVAPVAIFADLTILVQAPRELIAAGFADMCAKFTSIVDWKFSHIVAGEPYCEAVARLTEEALLSCVTNIESIAACQIEGIEYLTQALIQSGIAMTIFGQSHPASGAEHHLSHYWEMVFLREGKKQLLHGAKVGVATIQIAKLYHDIANQSERMRWSKSETMVHPTVERINSNWSLIVSWIQAIPSAAQFTKWFQLVGAPTSIDQLGITELLLQQSFREAYHLRNRYTILRAYSELRTIE